MRHMAKFKLTAELLRKALNMPDGTEIYNIVRAEMWPDTFVFFVEHPELPEIPEGGQPYEITPVLTEYKDGVRWYWNDHA